MGPLAKILEALAYGAPMIQTPTGPIAPPLARTSAKLFVKYAGRKQIICTVFPKSKTVTKQAFLIASVIHFHELYTEHSMYFILKTDTYR